MTCRLCSVRCEEVIALRMLVRELKAALALALLPSDKPVSEIVKTDMDIISQLPSEEM